MKPPIEEESFEGLTFDESLQYDMACFVEKYMKSLPNTSFEDMDFWIVADDMVRHFGKLIDRQEEEKIRQQNTKGLS